jgi:hypothetical protein
LKEESEIHRQEKDRMRRLEQLSGEEQRLLDSEEATRNRKIGTYMVPCSGALESQQQMVKAQQERALEQQSRADSQSNCKRQISDIRDIIAQRIEAFHLRTKARQERMSTFRQQTQQQKNYPAVRTFFTRNNVERMRQEEQDALMSSEAQLDSNKQEIEGLISLQKSELARSKMNEELRHEMEEKCTQIDTVVASSWGHYPKERTEDEDLTFLQEMQALEKRINGGLHSLRAQLTDEKQYLDTEQQDLVKNQDPTFENGLEAIKVGLETELCRYKEERDMVLEEEKLLEQERVLRKDKETSAEQLLGSIESAQTEAKNRLSEVQQTDYRLGINPGDVPMLMEKYRQEAQQNTTVANDFLAKANEIFRTQQNADAYTIARGPQASAMAPPPLAETAAQDVPFLEAAKKKAQENFRLREQYMSELYKLRAKIDGVQKQDSNPILDAAQVHEEDKWLQDMLERRQALRRSKEDLTRLLTQQEGQLESDVAIDRCHHILSHPALSHFISLYFILSYTHLIPFSLSRSILSQCILFHPIPSCEHTHTHTHIYIYIFACVCVCVYMYIHIYIYICVCVYNLRLYQQGQLQDVGAVSHGGVPLCSNNGAKPQHHPKGRVDHQARVRSCAAETPEYPGREARKDGRKEGKTEGRKLYIHIVHKYMRVCINPFFLVSSFLSIQERERQRVHQQEQQRLREQQQRQQDEAVRRQQQLQQQAERQRQNSQPPPPPPPAS